MSVFKVAAELVKQMPGVTKLVAEGLKKGYSIAGKIMRSWR